MSAQRDPELDDLFEGEPELREFAQFMRGRPHPAANVEPSPRFRMVLKQRLMREAWERASRPRLPWYRRLLAPQSLAWAGAAVGALLIGFTVFMFFNTSAPNTTVFVHSELDGAQTVKVEKPIPLTFTQPMDASSVAVKIVPATEVRYAWQDNNTRLTITPVHQLTPNTQYEVSVASSAKTQSGQALTNAKPVHFVTTSPPAPSPTAQPSPSSTPTPLPIETPRSVAPIGTPAARWSSDGARLYVISPSGQLQAWPIAGGAAASIQPDGVTLVAVGPDGNPAYVRDGKITYNSLSVPGVQPIALGFRQGGALIFATTSDVQSSDQQKLVHFAEEAAGADFSPAGDRLVYRSASGSLHLVDLTARPARDTVVGPASGLGDWSSDGTKYAYPTDAAVHVADTATGSSSRLADLAGVGGVAWSRSTNNQLLLSTSSALYLYSQGDPAGTRKLSAGAFGQPSWSPGGGGYFSFRRSAEVWVSKVVGPLGGGTSSTPGSGSSQDDVVNGFIAARKNGQSDLAMSYLDAAGKDAFSKLILVYIDPAQSLARHNILLSQPNRVVVRLVLGKGTSQSAVDETLVLQSSGGKLLIHGVTETARTSFGAGPEIVKVVVSSDHVQVSFDSDLDQASIGGVSLKGVTSRASYDAANKAVTLTVTGGLTPGATYDLLLGSGLRDTPNGRQAVLYDLQFVWPPAGS